jgi:CubicO group peptidase (beta-lactamase class C family)
MKKIIPILFILLSCSFVAQHKLTTELNNLVEESAAANAFSGNTILIKNGEVLFKKSKGFSDWETKTLLNDSTLFNIGSIGKDFTRLIILQLEGEKRLQFDDPLTKFLDMFPDSIGKKITLRMLLTMQSGLGDYHERPFRNLQERIDYIKTLPLLFEPGTSREYSNSGYVVLAAVIEKITGKPYEKNVQERIFAPLKMNQSFFIYPGMKVPNKASGTDIKPNGEKVNEHMINDELTPSGDGGCYSSAPDLVKFNLSLLTDNILLSDNQKVAYFTNFNPATKRNWAALKADTNIQTSFAGGLNGWNSCVDLYFGKEYILVTLCNLSDSDLPAEEFNRRVGQILGGKKYDAPKIPRFVFAYNQYKKLGVENFTKQINDLLREKEYLELQGPYFYNTISEQLMEEGEYKDASAILKYNTELFPEAPRTWLMLGKAYNTLGKKEEAKIALKNCLKIDPENREAEKLLSEL